MSFKSETYRVLIASPSDLAEERQAASETVNDWNALHAVAESVVLLPVKWETHAMPQSGVRPQRSYQPPNCPRKRHLGGHVLDQGRQQHWGR